MWQSRLKLGALAVAGFIGFTAPGYAQNTQQGPSGQQGQGRQQQTQQAQAPKSMKDALVGTWRLLIDDAVNPDNTQTPQFGPNPMGTLIFTANGHYSLQVMRDNRPKFSANDRMKGTADENKTAIQGITSHFGTYSVDEASKTLTFHIEGSAFPNWDGTTQKRTITSLTPNDELTYTLSMPSGGALPVTLAWKWVP
jgi:Lipocalin-like domain